ncbi:hypothetical protein FTX61_07220 [Nitriliruptoraceae bacterium ZYF776]|nr:hypothetical protein [Profundirhabdus halotolerans]
MCTSAKVARVAVRGADAAVRDPTRALTTRAVGALPRYPSPRPSCQRGAPSGPVSVRWSALTALRAAGRTAVTYGRGRRSVPGGTFLLCPQPRPAGTMSLRVTAKGGATGRENHDA